MENLMTSRLLKYLGLGRFLPEFTNFILWGIFLASMASFNPACEDLFNWN